MSAIRRRFELHRAKARWINDRLAELDGPSRLDRLSVPQ